MNLLSELKRRNVFRMAVLYAVVAWLIMQAAEVVIGLAHLPHWIGPTTLGLLAVGFPIALILSWFYEITSEGITLEKDVDRSDSITHVTGRRLDFIVISLLCAAVILFAYDKWWIGGPPQQSIAVLPFVNMSDDASNEYFSDGISEELLNLLTKIPELRVISRSSAFSYKGKDIDIPTIAAQLNVAHVLEGSVRKAGNRVRITAQLIEARTDTHLWSETYDRSLDNIFAIQDEIASAVVEQLKVVLLHDAPVVRETDPQTYALYLQGRHLRRQNTARSLGQAQVLLQQALESDPGYAAVWNELGSVYINQGNIGLRPIDETRTLSREAVSKALSIDAGFALAHANLGWIVRGSDFDLSAAAQHFERALQLEPANTDIIRRAANLTASLGRLDEAIALNEFVIARDPISHSSYNNRGLYYLYAGRWDEAIASMRIALTLSPGYGGAQFRIGVALLFKDEPQAALEAMQLEDSVWGMVGLPMAYHALGRAGASDAALAELIEQHEQGWAYNIAYVFAYRGETDRAFEWLDKAVEYKDAGLSNILGERLFSDIQDDLRWLPFLESIGKSPEQLAVIEFKVTLPE